MSSHHGLLFFLMILCLLTACGGGGGSGGSGGNTGPNQGPPPCTINCPGQENYLTEDDIKAVLSQAIQEAQQRNANATIALADRVGNVLAVYRMDDQAVLISSTSLGEPTIDGGLEGIFVDPNVLGIAIDDQAAITKAITAAYLSSNGNAFSTRTASQIIQKHFNPGETGQPSGPLFGVQFSQLACSDFTLSASPPLADAGPKHTPLGLAADPGGLPLYKNGLLVGGLGVIADGRYGLDKGITDLDNDLDELIATAGTSGFQAPTDIRADRITVEGKTLRFSDASPSDLATDPAAAAAFDTLPMGTGALIAVTGYNNGTIVEGLPFGESASGIRADGSSFYPGLDAFVMVDNNDQERFPPVAGTDGSNLTSSGVQPLAASEVQEIIRAALAVANRARAQIRRPLGSSARVTVAVVDTNGAVLGMARSNDAPVFGSDVSLQKARTATFFSSANAASFLGALPTARYLEVGNGGASVSQSVAIGNYVNAVRSFLSQPSALADGAIAFSDRAGGNLSRPHFPDGIDANGPGPLSKPASEWSPFSTGLQLDLVINGILQHVLQTAGLINNAVGNNCVGIAIANDLSSFSPTAPGGNIAGGIQIFPGSVPIYRGDVLVGGIGVSGDGVDQDDMIAFLGIHEAADALGGAINNAPPSMRADQLTPQGVRLRYIQCPQSPYNNSQEQNVCDGK